MNDRDAAAIKSLIRRLDEAVSAEEGIGALSRAERVLFCAITGKLQLDDNGFRCLFETGLSVVEVAASFRALGRTAMAEACASAVKKLFPEGEPADWKIRQRLFLAAPRNLLLSEEEIVQSEKSELLQEAMVAYARENRVIEPELDERQHADQKN